MVMHSTNKETNKHVFYLPINDTQSDLDIDINQNRHIHDYTQDKKGFVNYFFIRRKQIMLEGRRTKYF
jgi:hypothetical protein